MTYSQQVSRGATRQPVALLVDDEPLNLMLLQALIEQLGYRVNTAENGAEAVACFAAEGADVVLMDVIMPVMDGYAATREIKRLADDEHVPVIFVTALTDEGQLAACVAAGGDDFISKPINLTLLEARIRAAERMRDLHREAVRRRVELADEQELARHVFFNVVEHGNTPVSGLQTLARGAVQFSGDVVLSATGPDDAVTVMVGDFTGHGLAAALGALPVTQIFRAMVSKGFSPQHILQEINQELVTMLPAGRFLAAVLLRMTSDGHGCAVYNAGLPEVLVLDRCGGIRQRVASGSLPLGIRASLIIGPPTWLDLEHGDCVIVATDGVSEAHDEQGRMFGQERLEAVYQAGEPMQVIARVENTLTAYCGEADLHDDLTLIALHAQPRFTAPVDDRVMEVSTETQPGSQWRWLLELGADNIRHTDVVPMIMTQVRELFGRGVLPATLFTVVSELFANALDHGVLGLQSAAKDSAEGFARYYSEREARLLALRGGWIRIAMEREPGGDLRLEFEDSGAGFDHAALVAQRTVGQTDMQALSGRGIALVRELCREVYYQGRGNHVVAVFSMTARSPDVALKEQRA